MIDFTDAFPVINIYSKDNISSNAITDVQANIGAMYDNTFPSQWWNYYINSITTNINNCSTLFEDLKKEFDFLKNDNNMHKYIANSIKSMHLPIGSIILGGLNLYDMSNYLLLNGQSFDRNTYPELYAVLGTNKLPDFREVIPKGAESNNLGHIAEWNYADHSHVYDRWGWGRNEDLSDEDIGCVHDRWDASRTSMTQIPVSNEVLNYSNTFRTKSITCNFYIRAKNV